MKAQELRIGNWAYKCLRSGNGRKVPHKLEIEDLVRIATNVGPFVFEPIPLTKEILVKAGFEKQDNGWKRLSICNDWTYIYWQKLAGVELSVNKHSCMIPSIKYLHQLQNLFYALTFTELPIEL